MLSSNSLDSSYVDPEWCDDYISLLNLVFSCLQSFTRLSGNIESEFWGFKFQLEMIFKWSSFELGMWVYLIAVIDCTFNFLRLYHVIYLAFALFAIELGNPNN